MEILLIILSFTYFTSAKYFLFCLMAYLQVDSYQKLKLLSTYSTIFRHGSTYEDLSLKRY